MCHKDSSHLFFEQLNQHLIDLNDQQKAVATTGHGVHLILAVPGGGKTTTLLCRTAYLVQCLGVLPGQILTLTFSRASANDMSERFKQLFMGMIQHPMHFSTIHSFAYRVVMSFYQRTGEKVTLIEGFEQGGITKSQLLKQVYHKVNHAYLPEGDYESLANDLSYVKNIMLSPGKLKKYTSGIQNFFKIVEVYEAEKQAQGYMDFDDMLSRCYEILSQHPSLLTTYQKQYTHIQVDEAQDTSLLQHSIIQLLAQKSGNLFYVADDDQSIYGFRGAFPEYLLQLKHTYPNAEIYRMESNYRSTGHIVSACNQFIKKNQARYDKHMQPEKDLGLPIEICTVKTPKEQYKVLVEHLNGQDRLVDQAVLYRNNESAVFIANYLHKRGIPFYIRDFKKKFFDHFIITDMIHILYFSKNIQDSHLFNQFYYKLKGYYISKVMMQSVANIPGEASVFVKLLKNSQLERYKVDKIRDLAYHFQQLEKKTPEKAIDYIYMSMGYQDFLKDRTGQSNTLMASYEAMIDLLKNLSEGLTSVHELVQALKTLENVMRDANKKKAQALVTLSTVHASKGLEWDVVHMMDLIDGKFPAAKREDQKDTLWMEEERRLFYVGMTRARHHLQLYHVTQMPPSVFLNEMKMVLSVPKNLDVGKQVVHKRFGNGVVTKCLPGKIYVRFNDQERVFNYQYTFGKNMLKTIE